MYFTGHIQTQLMGKWTFGWHSMLTSLSSLHTMTQWHKWAKILDGGDDLGVLAVSTTEELSSPSAVCHHLLFGGIFHCCVKPNTFQLARAPSTVPFTHACPRPHIRPALLETLAEKASKVSLCLLLSQASSPSGWYCFWFLQDIAMESLHFSFLNCCLLDCRECNTVYNIIHCNWLYNLRIKITLHCAKIKYFHWLLLIFPSRIIH